MNANHALSQLSYSPILLAFFSVILRCTSLARQLRTDVRAFLAQSRALPNKKILRKIFFFKTHPNLTKAGLPEL